MKTKAEWRLHNLIDALTALSLPQDEQVRVTEPGCVPCDLCDDFELALRLSREASDPWATRNEALQAVEAAVTVAGSEPYECFDNTVLARPAWQVVRRCAQDALRALGSSEATIESYVEVAPGVWHRRPSPWPQA
jgi:hypothetical protein